MALRVIKLGGSLLDLADLRARLGDWLARQTPAESVMLVGGGRWVETLREADRRHNLGDEACHWLAIRAMGLTAGIVDAMLPRSRLVSKLADLDRRTDRLTLLDPWDFLQEGGTSGVTPLPHSWDVTSDSIAARVAKRLGAGELVLLKSRLPDAETVSQAARCGYVDRYFPRAMAGLRVRYVNFREAAFAERTLT